jgi:hypothetical protein
MVVGGETALGVLLRLVGGDAPPFIVFDIREALLGELGSALWGELHSKTHFRISALLAMLKSSRSLISGIIPPLFSCSESANCNLSATV